ncbi:hypothetical protein B0H13DRAFT_2029193, partial [Mycena leptocephala]
ATFLFSLEQSEASFRHGHPSDIVFRDSAHGAYLYRNDNGEGINAGPEGSGVCADQMYGCTHVGSFHLDTTPAVRGNSERRRESDGNGRPRSPTARPELRTRRKRGALQVCIDYTDELEGAHALEVYGNAFAYLKAAPDVQQTPSKASSRG